MGLLSSRSTSFRVQLALVFGAIVVALVTLLSVVLGRMMSQTIRTEAGHSLQIVADNAALMLGEGVEDRLRLVQTIANSPTLWSRGLASLDVNNTFSRLQSIRENLAWMGVADTTGEVQAATGDLLVGADVSARPWFAAGLTGPHVGDLHGAKLLAKLLPNARNGEPQRFIDFAAPIQRDGRTIGVIGIHGSWDWARSVLESLTPKNAAARAPEIFIFDREGTMIFAPGNDTESRLRASQRQPVISSQTAGASEAIQWVDGKSYLTAIAPVEPKNALARLGWSVVARLPADTAFAGARAATLDVLAIGAVASLLAAGLAWVVAGNVTRPLSAIAKAARTLRHGRGGVDLPQLRSSREVIELSDALTEMTTRLLSANDDLEARVQARTSELEAANAELSHLARFDALTELYNRRGFEEQMHLAVLGARRRNSPLSILMIDADHFKRVNDTHGHEAGDRVLQTLARLLKQRLRESDIVGRIGGEEFVALLPDTDLANARCVADELVHMVGATDIPVVGHVTISCGVTALHAGDEGLSALRRADAALYRAKSHGRNRASFQHSSLEPVGID